MFSCELDWLCMLDNGPFAGPAVKEKAKHNNPNVVVEFW